MSWLGSAVGSRMRVRVQVTVGEVVLVPIRRDLHCFALEPSPPLELLLRYRWLFVFVRSTVSFHRSFVRGIPALLIVLLFFVRCVH